MGTAVVGDHNGVFYDVALLQGQAVEINGSLLEGNCWRHRPDRVQASANVDEVLLKGKWRIRGALELYLPLDSAIRVNCSKLSLISIRNISNTHYTGCRCL